MNTLYPIFLKLERKPVLVIGGGKVAEQKVKGLLAANANITVLAPRTTEWIHQLASENKIALLTKKYSDNDVKGFFLVFAATNNPEVHEKIFYDAAKWNIPVNVVDVPDLCNFYLASLFQNGDLKIAVSTNGKSPTLGKIIRDRIAAEFGKGYPELLNTLGEIRPDVHSAFSDPDQRKEVLEKIVDNELRKFHLNNTANNNYEVRNPKSEILKRETLQAESSKGRVILVGAGPGDPELISVKGLRAVQQADVIAYDALISPELLDAAKPGCEKIFVGKRADGHYASQEEINAILLSKSKEGKLVVRLKGGDPFVFGRGGEELRALREERIDVEIIPGITAGTGIPSSLGIPLTSRNVSSNVVFVTGNESEEKKRRIDWKSIAAIDTIVIYMGVKNLNNIIAKLIEAGRSLHTPVAVIVSGTTTREAVIDATLETIALKLEQATLDGPGLIIIGDVVSFLKTNPSYNNFFCPEWAVK